jgi:hypothetical protein
MAARGRVDGPWQFTDWAHASLAAKLDLLDQQVTAELQGHRHLLGVVVSSGPLVDLHGAVAESAGRPGEPVALRRILSPAQVREILLLPLRPSARPSAHLLTSAYDAEPAWLDRDLADCGLATTSQLWTDG